MAPQRHRHDTLLDLLARIMNTDPLIGRNIGKEGRIHHSLPHIQMCKLVAVLLDGKIARTCRKSKKAGIVPAPAQTDHISARSTPGAYKHMHIPEHIQHIAPGKSIAAPDSM